MKKLFFLLMFSLLTMISCDNDNEMELNYTIKTNTEIVTLKVGEQRSFSTTVSPSLPEDVKMKATCYNEQIATVSLGENSYTYIVTAHSEGESIIQIMATVGGRPSKSKKEIKVIVTKN